VNRKTTLNNRLGFTTVLLIFGLWTEVNAADTLVPEIVVTATRTQKTVDDSLASVTVITRKEIANSQAITLSDVLRGVPGLDVTNNGGFGQTISRFMRGTESSHILVLVDGIKIGSATTSGVAFEHLPLSQIERIEIVRGPRSSLYGSEAIGGVIQIFTRKGSGKPRTEASISMGDDSTYQVTAGLSGSTKDNWFNLYADYLQTDGFNACQGSNTAACFAIEPDDDGYENTSLSAKLGHRFGDKGNIEFHALQAQGNTQYDPGGNPQYAPTFITVDFVQQVLGIKADYVASDRWLINLNMGQSLDEFDKSPQSYFHTTRTTASLVNNLLFSKQKTLIIGYDYQQDNVDSHIAYAVDSLDNEGMFIESQTQSGRTNFIWGLRRDDNEQFGSHTTGNFGLGYALTPTTRFIANYGTAFKAPSFNELYFPNFGNPNLVPEESKSFEIGLMGTQPYYRWALNVYHTRIDKLIAANFDAATGNDFADNINKAKIVGMDGAVTRQRGNWEFSTKVSWLKPEDEKTGNLLPRRAEKTVNIFIAERRGAMRLGINLLAQSSRYDDIANTTRLGGYGILNLTGEYNFNKHWALRARLENTLNKEYETAYLYNTPGRFWFFGIHYQQ